jgi:hypothetical protein
MGWSPVQVVLSTVYKIKILEVILNGNMPDSLIRRGRKGEEEFIKWDVKK